MVEALYGESEGKNGLGIFPASVEYNADLHSMGQYIQGRPAPSDGDGRELLLLSPADTPFPPMRTTATDSIILPDTISTRSPPLPARR